MNYTSELALAMLLHNAASVELYILKENLWDMQERSSVANAARVGTANLMSRECFTEEWGWHEKSQ